MKLLPVLSLLPSRLSHVWARRCLAILACVTVSPATQAAAPAAPVCTGGEYRAFDFWVGDWDTFDPDQKNQTTSIARNHVDLILDGCVLREDYDRNDGLHGQSFTIYDAKRKVWHQSWVTNHGALLVLEGTQTGKRITLEGDSITPKGKQRTRVFWEPQGDGVRETATVSEDGGGTWKPLFDVVFRRHRG